MLKKTRGLLLQNAPLRRATINFRSRSLPGAGRICRRLDWEGVEMTICLQQVSPLGCQSARQQLQISKAANRFDSEPNLPQRCKPWFWPEPAPSLATNPLIMPPCPVGLHGGYPDMLVLSKDRRWEHMRIIYVTCRAQRRGPVGLREGILSHFPLLIPRSCTTPAKSYSELKEHIAPLAPPGPPSPPIIPHHFIAFPPI